MKKMLDKIFIFVLILLVVGIVYFGRKLAPVGSAFAAKALCSCAFISERNPQTVFEEELGAPGYLNYQVNTTEKTATADVFGFFERKAIYRPGLGCTLVLGLSEHEIRESIDLQALQAPASVATDWALGDSMYAPSSETKQKLSEVLDWAFDEPDPAHIKRTRGVVVVHKGHIVAERYADGYTAETPQMGWSMGKSITHALVGILVKQGKLDIHAPAPVDAWSQETDPRHPITTDQLLRMSSGLKFEETYSLLTDVTNMLFTVPNAGAYAAAMPLKSEPDTEWSYASGTTNILHLILKKQLGGSHLDYLNFPRQELFDPIGMNSVIMEVDASGHFVGSSFDYATPRDWARFGMLYLHDGVWNGNRILPEGWVTYAHTPTPTEPGGTYGAHFWLNAGQKRWPSLPAEVYRAAGYEGQSVTIIPSKDLVIVRLGQTDVREDWDYEAFVGKVLGAM